MKTIMVILLSTILVVSSSSVVNAEIWQNVADKTVTAASRDRIVTVYTLKNNAGEEQKLGEKSEDYRGLTMVKLTLEAEKDVIKADGYVDSLIADLDVKIAKLQSKLDAMDAFK